MKSIDKKQFINQLWFELAVRWVELYIVHSYRTKEYPIIYACLYLNIEVYLLYYSMSMYLVYNFIKMSILICDWFVL